MTNTHGHGSSSSTPSALKGTLDNTGVQPDRSQVSVWAITQRRGCQSRHNDDAQGGDEPTLGRHELVARIVGSVRGHVLHRLPA